MSQHHSHADDLEEIPQDYLDFEKIFSSQTGVRRINSHMSRRLGEGKLLVGGSPNGHRMDEQTGGGSAWSLWSSSPGRKLLGMIDSLHGHLGGHKLSTTQRHQIRLAQPTVAAGGARDVTAASPLPTGGDAGGAAGTAATTATAGPGSSRDSAGADAVTDAAAASQRPLSGSARDSYDFGSWDLEREALYVDYVDYDAVDLVPEPDSADAAAAAGSTAGSTAAGGAGSDGEGDRDGAEPFVDLTDLDYAWRDWDTYLEALANGDAPEVAPATEVAGGGDEAGSGSTAAALADTEAAASDEVAQADVYDMYMDYVYGVWDEVYGVDGREHAAAAGAGLPSPSSAPAAAEAATDAVSEMGAPVGAEGAAAVQGAAAAAAAVTAPLDSGVDDGADCARRHDVYDDYFSFMYGMWDSLDVAPELDRAAGEGSVATAAAGSPAEGSWVAVATAAALTGANAQDNVEGVDDDGYTRFYTGGPADDSSPGGGAAAAPGEGRDGSDGGGGSGGSDGTSDRYGSLGASGGGGADAAAGGAVWTEELQLLAAFQYSVNGDEYGSYTVPTTGTSAGGAGAGGEVGEQPEAAGGAAGPSPAAALALPGRAGEGGSPNGGQGGGVTA
ncbi:hypothetical protein GPECTOR_60g760 [Gonium pectorale]|uniref:Uncharacterized protein n=1 Tax=Gonium pectorale TaxID=33097 RepID=A0A150G555_GONPE|nr:hypothetical protein GPECTOR_60g760 [Gonium pectorale]|eukprot:KXZ44982.1 hypothetical protein GPECTOR_60g760 [Gonium pectorale]